jgi:hypothetical protein
LGWWQWRTRKLGRWWGKFSLKVKLEIQWCPTKRGATGLHPLCLQ